MAKTNPKVTARQKRIKRIRKKIVGTPEKQRMRVFRSNKHIYVQIIDDIKKATLVSASSLDKDFEVESGADKIAQAKKIGETIAQRAQSAGINNVVFDRGGYIYHGRVKALSDGAREAGLQF